jgi:hypothetical protein
VPNLAMQANQGPPPIPPVPPSAGAATGGQAVGVSPPSGTGVGPATTREVIQNAINEAQQAAEAGQAGQAVILQPPPTFRGDSPIPREVVPIIAIVFGSIAFMVVFGPITRGIMRMIERRQESNMVKGPPIAEQLYALQQSVDTMAIELERISESQRFQSKLMNERTALPPKSGS